MSWADVGEVVKAVAPGFTAGAAWCAAYLGYRGLGRWREETIGKRKADLAEQALTAFFQARHVLKGVRSRGFFGEEGSSRRPAAGENPKQQELRNLYYIPIERLNRNYELFAKIQTLSYLFSAHFGEISLRPFNAILSVPKEIESAASILVQMTSGDDTEDATAQRSKEQLFDTLGWGQSMGPDAIDRKIDGAVQDMEKLCRPVLMATRS
jgi:hypothetical protein